MWYDLFQCLQLAVMGTGMPMPTFARMLAKNPMPAMPMPEDLQKSKCPFAHARKKSPNPQNIGHAYTGRFPVFFICRR